MVALLFAAQQPTSKDARTVLKKATTVFSLSLGARHAFYLLWLREYTSASFEKFTLKMQRGQLGAQEPVWQL